jgi:hypothetical protein
MAAAPARMRAEMRSVFVSTKPRLFALLGMTQEVSKINSIFDDIDDIRSYKYGDHNPAGDRRNHHAAC